MNAANISIGMHAKPSTGELLEQARVIKSLMSRGDDIAMSLSEMFGPTGTSDLESMDEIRHVKGWQWTAVLAKSLQFVMADLSVYLRKDLAEQIRQLDPVISRSADQVMLQSQDIPKNYEPAPDDYLVKRLLQQPNPWTSQEHFKFDIGLQFTTHGVCHILVIPDEDGYPAQLFVIPKTLIQPQMPTRQNPTGSYRVGRLTRYATLSDPRMNDSDFQPQTLQEAYSWLSDREYPAKYVIKIEIPSLLWRDTNSSPSKAMSNTLMVDDAIQESRKATMNSQQSRGPRLKEKDGISLSPDQKEEYLSRYERENHGLSTEGAPRWASDLFDVENPMDTAREMEYTEGSIESRDSILGQNMVPPSIVGLGDSAGFAAVIGSAKQWATFCGQPMMDLMAGQLTTGLRTFFEKPLNEFLVKMQTGRIDDDQVEETKLMNDMAAGTITKGEWRDARKRPRFGDERDDELAGPSNTMGNQLDGLAAASYGEGEDLEGEVPTPGLGAAVQDDPSQPTKGEMANLSRLQFGRNRKSIEEQVERFANGELRRPVAMQFLLMLGVSEERAKSLLDAVDPSLETAAEQQPVEIPPGIDKAFGAPVESGLPYLLTWLPDELRGRVEEWRKLVVTQPGQDPGEPHVTLYGPVLDSGQEAVQRIQAIFEKQQLPAEVAIGAVKIFRNVEHDVAVLECRSHGLTAIWNELDKVIRSPLRPHSLQLHITLAYGPKGAFDSYEGAALAGLHGHRYLVREATLGTRENILERFAIGKPEVLSPAPSGITYGVPAVKSADPAPYGYCPTCGSEGVSRERRIGGNDKCSNGHEYPSAAALSEKSAVKSVQGMSTTTAEGGGALVKPKEPEMELKATGQRVKIGNATLDVFVDKDGNRWVTLENEVRVMIDGDGNVLAGPPGMASVKPGAKKRPTADMTDTPTVTTPEVQQPAGEDASTTTQNPVQKPKKPRVAAIRDKSRTDVTLQDRDYFQESYRKAERHLDSRRANALSATESLVDEHSNVKMKRIEAEMQLESKISELNDPRPMSREEISARVGEIQRLRQQIEQQRQAEAASREKLHETFRQSLGIEPSYAPVKMTESQAAIQQSRAEITEGMGTVRLWAKEEVLARTNIGVLTTAEANAARSIHGSDNLRSYAYVDKDGTNKIAIAPGATADVMTHEIGHCIEDSSWQVKKLASGFLKKRTEGETPIQLNTKFPWFEPHEIGMKDEFDRVFQESSAYYVGKTYADGGTEVVSMGLQQLHNDPIRFAENDPEYFNLMVGILQGTLK